MIIDAFLTPALPEKEEQFSNSIVLMIDVLRASTTVAAALSNGAKEILVVESLEKAVKIFNSLSRGAAVLGGERGGLKPSGFDAGNSPYDYPPELVDNKTVILTTSNGTIVFQNAKQARARIIASFVNLNAVLDFIRKSISDDSSINSIILLAAGSNGQICYEDTICAGAFIHHLSDLPFKLTEVAKMARELYLLHSDDLFVFLKTCEHSTRLSNLGFSDDIYLAFTIDAFPVVPLIDGQSVRIASNGD